MERKTYIKISSSSCCGYVDELSNAQTFLESMADVCSEIGESESYSFTAVQMTTEEYKSLPEFKGFRWSDEAVVGREAALH